MASPRFSYKIGVWRLAFGVCLIRDVEHEIKNPRGNKQGEARGVGIVLFHQLGSYAGMFLTVPGTDISFEGRIRIW